jgi:hypothetical protein
MTLLKRITIPNAIMGIKDGAFSNCSGLATVTLGNGLEEIVKEAFHQCTRLEHIVRSC